MVGFFRDHYLSDLVGFVYSRMDAGAAAEDLYQRIRAIGERVSDRTPADGFADSGRRKRVGIFSGERARIPAAVLPADRQRSGHHAADGERSGGGGRRYSPEQWNFSGVVDQREFRRVDRIGRGRDGVGASEPGAGFLFAASRSTPYGAFRNAPTPQQLAASYEALLAAEGSDWCWWYGPEHSSANDAEFDAFYRKLLTEVYVTLGAEAPDVLAGPIKRQPERALILPPSAYLKVKVDGRESTYFEWMGAGLYSADRRSSAMHGRLTMLHEIRYGFSEKEFFLRVDMFPGALAELRDAEFRITLRAEQELRIVIHLKNAHVKGYLVESRELCLLGPEESVRVACDKILEVSVARQMLQLGERKVFSVGAALWEGGLPLDLLPEEGLMEVRLGEENFGWAVK